MAYDLKLSQKALAEHDLTLRAKLIEEGKFTEEDFANVPAPVDKSEVPLDQSAELVDSDTDSSSETDLPKLETETNEPNEVAPKVGEASQSDGGLTDLPKSVLESPETGESSLEGTLPDGGLTDAELALGLVEEYEAELVIEEADLVPEEVEKSKGKKSKK